MHGYHELFSEYVGRRELAQQCIVGPGESVPAPVYVTRMVRVPTKSVKVEAGEAVWRAIIEHPLPSPLRAR